MIGAQHSDSKEKMLSRFRSTTSTFIRGSSRATLASLTSLSTQQHAFYHVKSIQYLPKETATQLEQVLQSLKSKTGTLEAASTKLPRTLLGDFEKILKTCWNSSPIVVQLENDDKMNQYGMNIGSATTLLLAQCVAKECFELDDLKKLYSPEQIREQTSINYEVSAQYPQQVMDDTFYLCSLFDTLIASASQPSTTSSVVEYSKENLIAASYLLLICLRGTTMLTPDTLAYAQYILEEYGKSKDRYVKSNVMSEDEFDWFEELETGIPIHLGSLVKAISATYNAKSQNKTQIIEIIDEAIQKNPQNPLMYFLKAKSYLMGLQLKDKDSIRELGLKAIESADKALDILKSFKPLPLPKISKTQFCNYETDHVERVNDFKFLPIHYFKALTFTVLTKVANQPQQKHEYGKKGWEAMSHVELYSRLPYSVPLLMNKASLIGEEYEKILETLSAVYKFFPIERVAQYQAILTRAGIMIKLGRFESCLQMLNEVVDKFDNDQQIVLRQIYCHEKLARSKEDLSKVLQMYNDLKKNCEPNFVPMIEPMIKEVEDRLRSD